jgi:hypothetical protein
MTEHVPHNEHTFITVQAAILKAADTNEDGIVTHQELQRVEQFLREGTHDSLDTSTSPAKKSPDGWVYPLDIFTNMSRHTYRELEVDAHLLSRVITAQLGMATLSCYSPMLIHATITSMMKELYALHQRGLFQHADQFIQQLYTYASKLKNDGYK